MLERFGRGARSAEKLIDTVIALILLMIVAFASYSLWTSYQLFNGAFLSDELRAIKPGVEAKSGQVRGFDELLKLNPDVRAWVSIPKTHIDYPVVQGRDNMSYINKGVEGEFTMAGSIFLDSANSSDFRDPYSLLYGHHMENGAMFGDLARFSDRIYFDERPTGKLITSNAEYTIEFFAFVAADGYDALIFNPSQIVSGAQREALLEHVRNKAIHRREIALSASDRIIALSTCTTATTNGRTLMFGRLTKR